MKRRINFNIFTVLISLVLCVLYKPGLNESFDGLQNFALSIFAIINVLIFWNTSIKITKSWVNYNTLFLLGFLIVHFQIPFLASIGIEPIRPSFIWINKSVVNYAVWLSVLALLLWILGSLLYYNKARKRNVQKVAIYNIDTKKIDALLTVFLILFILLVGQKFLRGSYDGGRNWGAGANYAYLILRILILLRILYFFINTSHLKLSIKKIIRLIFRNKIFVIILIIYFLIFLLSGDRGPILEILILCAVSYSLYQKKISFGFFVTALVIGGFLLTIIGLGRSRDSSEQNQNLFTQGYEKLINSDKAFNPTNELASSNRILFRAIDVVPDKHPYLYGTTFVTEIIGVFPFGANAFLTITQLPEMYISSSYFFTILGQGQFYTYGEGSEILGDIYINFGFYGVLILMFGLGYFIAFITTNALYTYNHRYILIYVILTIGALYLNRSNYLEPFKLIVYAIALDRLLTRKNIL
ncbi:MAG TPA: O-antigen polysaccharide polymerase Wzy [Aequorivita sp.]|nr:O-antigen polysaccharide polymerase Wzy [Aequorivita sp.]